MRSRTKTIAIVGAGLAGLTSALELASRGIDCVLLDDDDTVGASGLSSRGICYAKRTLEIFDRLGIGQRVVDKGVTWNVGRTFHGDREVFSFDLLPEGGISGDGAELDHGLAFERRGKSGGTVVADDFFERICQ